jgi:rhamnosyltransferase
MKSCAPGETTSGTDVCAIAVTYHPDATFPARADRILRQVGGLVIVDNGSSATEIEMLRSLASNPSVTLELNGFNLGIARALNIGIQRIAALGFKWALLFDQDTLIDEDMVATLLAVHAAFPQRAQLAVVGAGFRDVNAGLAESNADIIPDSWEDVESVITSGSLIPLSVHSAVGAFREEFFIDYVDTEYCFRARALGYRVIRTRKPIMSHSIGAITRHNVLGIKKWTFNHSAERRYYIARNNTVLLREYGNYAFGLWALKGLGRSVRLCKRIILYEDMKAGKIAAVAQGWWDGVRGHMGPRAQPQVDSSLT